MFANWKKLAILWQVFALKSTAAALIKLPTEKRLQSDFDLQKLIWSLEHCKLTSSWQPLSENFLMLAGKTHVGCKHRRSNIERELRKTIKATFGGLDSKLESSWSDSIHDFSCIIKSLSYSFWKSHSLWSLSCSTDMRNDHLISLLYCMVVQYLVEVDIHSECRCWKFCRFCFCSFVLANELEILYYFVMGENIRTKFFLLSFFFPCHAGSFCLRLFLSIMFK